MDSLEAIYKKITGKPIEDPTDLFILLKIPNTLLKAHIYREIRLNIQNYKSCLHLMDLYVLKSFTLQPCEELEQAVMLVQEWIQFDLPYSILNIIIAYSKEKEHVSKVCVGLLMECFINHPQLRISHYFMNNLTLNWRICDVSSFILVTSLEKPYSKSSMNIIPFLSLLIEPDVESPEIICQNSSKLIQLLLNTWQGYFYIKGNHLFWSIINQLLISKTEGTAEMVLSVLFQFFNTKLNHTKMNIVSSLDANLASLVLLDLINYSILESLVQILINPKLNPLATKVLDLIYKLSHQILNALTLKYVQDIFSGATCFTIPDNHTFDKAKLKELQELYPLHCQQLFVIDKSLQTFKTNQKFYSQINQSFDALYIVKGYNNNINSFTKSFTDSMCFNNAFNKPDQWQFENMHQLILELTNEVLLQEFVQNKCFKRLMQFFSIQNKEFVNLPKTCNSAIIAVFNSLIQILLNSEVGFKALSANEFITQYMNAFHLLIPSFTQTDQIFTQSALESTCIYYYIPLLQLFSRSSNGLTLLTNNAFFSTLLLIIDHASNQYVVSLILDFFYFFNQHGKGILLKLTTSTYEIIRLKSLNHFMDVPEPYKLYCLQILIECLHDPILKVKTKASECIVQTLTTTKYINMFIMYKPSIEILKLNKQLLYTLFTTPDGFDYLQSEIDIELRAFTCILNTKFVINYDTAQTCQLLKSNDINVFHKCKFDDEIELDYNYIEMPHLFYYLGKTKNGYHYLTCTIEFEHMVHELKHYDCNNYNSKDPVILRGILIAMGYLGMHMYGLMCLTDYNLLDTIINIGTTSKCPSIKGTCIGVLTLIASHSHGQEALKGKWKVDIIQSSTIRVNTCLKNTFYIVFILLI